MSTFVLVPGACHGAWWFEPLARQLREQGHQAYPLTLTGIGARRHQLTASVNLDTHIDDVVNLLEDEQITDAVLVGHSYAGMVITGAADRVPDRVEGLVYLDAFLPADGDSCWTLTTDVQREWYVGGSAATGYGVEPLPFFDQRATAHPLASMLQRIRLSGGTSRVKRKEFADVTEWGRAESPFRMSIERASQDPSFRVHVLESRHDVMRDVPEEILRILLEV
jgi:pimeloyl-ACP methyl ester carboxylesterase